MARESALLGRDTPVGLSRFSDAQHVFSPDILRPVLCELLEQSALREVISTRFGARLTPALTRVMDSTVWKVVPRMRWARWRGQHGQQQKAVPLHVKLRLADLQPTAATLSTGKRCERAVLREHLEAGEFHIGDRYYGEDHALFEQLEQHGCGGAGGRLDAQVELFFRWLKCLVPCRHWLAQSQQGVTLRVYLALNEALLLAERTGRKPG